MKNDEMNDDTMRKIKLVKGDITKLKVNAIVNAANNSLLGGSGVDGAIHNAAGSQVFDECMKIHNENGGCKTGDAVITSGGKLHAKYIIHTVGPIWKGGFYNEEKLLRSCYRRSLEVACENNIKTIAFPNISTGVYSFPKEKAAEIAITETINFLNENSDIDEIIFVCYDDKNYKIYQDYFKANNLV